MAISEALLEAARELGNALNASPVVQEYQQASEAIEKDQDLQALRLKVEQLYEDLINRQQNGEALSPGDIQAFNQLRGQYVQHPLIVRQEQCQRAVKALFEEAGGAISSILSVDYSQLVLE